MPELPATLEAEISIVLLGNFNPAIFHPEWFRRQELLEEAETEAAVANIISPEVSDISFLNFGLQIIMNRIVVKASDETRVPLIVDLVCALLTKLPHTPITAVGLNSSFHLQLANAEDWHLIGNTLAPKEVVWKDLYEKPGMTSVGIQSPRAGDYPGVINILVQPSVKFTHALFVHSNHEHRPQDEESAFHARSFIQASAGAALKEAHRVAEAIFAKILWKQPS